MNNENNATSAARQMEPIKYKNLLINFTTDYSRSSSAANGATKPRAFWRPTPPADLLPGYFPLGDVVAAGGENINGKRVTAVVCEGIAQNAETKALARPDDYEQVWRDSGSQSVGTLWRPVPPEGYVALGLVCSNDNEKPSLQAVRCVRADLVIASNVGETLWNNWDSGEQPPFVAWNVTPPVAPPGEIYFAAGTFIGYNNNAQNSTGISAYSLRMQIPLKINPSPAVPVLTGFVASEPEEASQPTQIATLPWFAVEDNALGPLERFRKSPYYHFERTDLFALIGYGHNTANKSKLFRWTASRVLIDNILRLFIRLTSIEIKTAWPIAGSTTSSPIGFSAQLNELFTRTETSNNEWTTSRGMEVAALVTKNKAVAAYQMQSHYNLRRLDGTEVAVNFAYADSNSLHFSVYPEEDTESCVAPEPVSPAQPATDTLP